MTNTECMQNILYRRDIVHAGTVTHISTLKTTTEDRSGKEEFGLKMIQLAMLLSKITFSLEPVRIQWGSTSKNWTKIARTHSDLSALVSWHGLSEWIHSICKDVMENMWPLRTLQGFSGDERAEHLLTEPTPELGEFMSDSLSGKKTGNPLCFFSCSIMKIKWKKWNWWYMISSNRYSSNLFTYNWDKSFRKKSRVVLWSRGGGVICC